MRLVQYLRSVALAVGITCLCSLAQAAVVTFDLDLKTAVSDSDTLTTCAVQVKGQQGGLLIKNTTNTTQSLKLIVKGLTEQEYDVYIDGIPTETKPAITLRDGLELNINGLEFDLKQLNCLRTVEPKLDAEKKRLEGEKKATQDEDRALRNIRLALEWAHSGIRADERNRSISVVLAPKGSELQKVSFPTKLSNKDATATLIKACTDMQIARDFMFHGLSDTMLRNIVVSALTPVSLSTQYTVANGVPGVSGKLVNDTNLPISGDITLNIPEGWKVKNNKQHMEVKPRESGTFSIPLVKMSKDAAVPTSLTTLAYVTITQGKYTASLQLRAEAKKQSE